MATDSSKSLQLPLNELVKKYKKNNKELLNPRKQSLDDSDVIALSQILENTKLYKDFNSKFHWVNSHGYQLHYEDISRWLIKTALSKNPKYAIEVLEKYNNTTVIPVTQLCILDSTIDEKFIFANGVSIRPYKVNLANYPHVVQSPENKPFAVLSFTESYSKSVTSKFHSIKVWSDPQYQEISDVIRCLYLTTSVENGINYIMYGRFVDMDLPFENESSGGWGLPTSYRSLILNSINKEELKSSNKVLRKYINLDSKFKDLLAIPIDRLNRFGYYKSDVDKAIDLRIALESLFLGSDNNDHNQLRYRLALRCARYIGKNTEEREKIFRKVKTVYDLTSSAVHGGKISKTQDINLLKYAADLIQKACLKLINNGKEIDWLRLELS